MKCIRNHIFKREYVQLFSESTARGFEYYREDLGLEEFKNTEPTEAMVRLLNNAFDVMNGRHIQESICKENWESKCKILNELLEAIDMSEHMSKEANLTPFLSQTTIEALRLTLTSIIDLTNDLFDDNYTFVLTGKFNQDCIEVFILLMNEKYVKHGNVDEEEQLELLVSYKKCLMEKCKTEK
ncbi:hypothetical protein OUZ56_011382 [Daphnia magna]|uniref:Transposable element P transposase-like GTP-binding insertion domain-containing protein n=1 Tax=Daphnia magna TaxID=35525 RepID=A0ABQ9YZY7_9CRUS|nr:hypothetical protein OUZ56_011382 [Daphnia magna]